MLVLLALSLVAVVSTGRAGGGGGGGGGGDGLASPRAPPTPRRLSISYYGAPNQNVTAENATFLASVGVTDVWVPYLAGAWAVDCCDCRTGNHGSRTCAYATEGLHAGLVSLQQAKDERLVETYAAAGINTWFFERPVPDFEWTGAVGTIGDGMWNSSAEIDAGWAAVADNISAVYPAVKAMGFAGLVYDNEGYYSKTCHDPGPVSCLWHQSSAFDKTVGGKLIRGNYYRRGKQIGAAIAAAWPNASIVMAYGFPYPGLVQWVEGHLDAGVRVQIGTEHTYGAGPCSGPYYTGQWYECAWTEAPAGSHHFAQVQIYAHLCVSRHACVLSGMCVSYCMLLARCWTWKPSSGHPLHR
jgi:hypothetical protein